jgi:hypothetical protein
MIGERIEMPRSQDVLGSPRSIGQADTVELVGWRVEGERDALQITAKVAIKNGDTVIDVRRVSFSPTGQNLSRLQTLEDRILEHMKTVLGWP